ncbi:LamB/YcsF family protein [Rhodococcus sp. EPR-157]|uniref:LamB/YcsF family protein n=1 Tax=Rhodococcus sp. EPR-157 TaxID=1813677 RepID=UPI001E60153F|nr:LamB/YcsF family protein [Rhodococcus sp. EPR-157]
MSDPSTVADRVLRLVRDGTIEAIDGSTIGIDAESVCVHGDSPGAVEMAFAVRKVLSDNDIDAIAFV